MANGGHEEDMGLLPWFIVLALLLGLLGATFAQHMQGHSILAP